MSAESHSRAMSFAMLVVVSIAVYTTAVWISLPHGVSLSDYLAVNNQRAPIAAGTVSYIVGIVLLAGAGLFIPKRASMLRSGATVTGLVGAAFGLLYVCLLIICNVDKVR